MDPLPMPFHHSVETGVQDLARAEGVLAQLTPFPWPGLTPLYDPDSSTNDPIEQDIQDVVPWFGDRIQVAGRVSITKPLSNALLIPAGLPQRWQFQPVFTVWPWATPTFDGISLFDLPQCTLEPGQRLFLRTTWTLSAGYQLDSSASAFVLSTQDLHFNNDISGITDPPTGTVTKTWHHLLATVDAAGVPVYTAWSTPFVPPSLS